MIPLILRLKKQNHREIAKAQDIIVKELYKIFPEAVVHGGTAIWRCFRGVRFSEDVDVYIPKNKELIEQFFKNLEKNGFVIEKKKISENSIYSQLTFNRTQVRFEAILKNEKGVLSDYETVDGNIITIYSLTPEQFIKEKVQAYLKRLKIRDFFDIFFLLRYVTHKEQISKGLNRLITEYRSPIDEKELTVLIYEGIVPTPEKMMEYIKKHG